MIDIIICVYNIEHYISECINSFLEQYDGSFRLLLIDDGSTDNSGMICDDYSKKHSFIQVIHKKNGGLSSARNAGLVESNSEYVWFFDGDDYIKDGSIARINDYLKSSQVDILFIEDARFMDGFEKKQRHIKSHISSKILKSNNKTKILKHLASLKRMRVSAWSAIFRRELIIKNNFVFKEGIAMEDVEWAPKVIVASERFGFLSGPIYIYRVRNNSLSHSPINDWKLLSLTNTIKENASQSIGLNNGFQWYINAFLCDFYLQLLYFLSKKSRYNAFPQDVKDLKWLLKYGLNKRSKLCRIISLLFGMSVLTKILKVL